MKISIENVGGQLGNDGVLFRINDNNNKALGRLEFGKAKLLWWPGKTSKNSTRIEMEFVDWLNSQ